MILAFVFLIALLKKITFVNLLRNGNAVEES